MADVTHKAVAAHESEMGLGRVEAFSDGVFSVAATLLVLNIQVPHLPNAQASDVIAELLKQWPAYLAYFITFMSMGAVWIGHHRTFKMYRSADTTLQLLNVFFLMFITLMPFSTAFFAEYIQQDTTIRLAVILYNVHWMIVGLLNAVMWRYARRANLLKADIDPAHLREVSDSFGLRGMQGTSIAIVVGLVAAIFIPQLTVAMSLLISFLYMRPLLRIFSPIPRTAETSAK